MVEAGFEEAHAGVWDPGAWEEVSGEDEGVFGGAGGEGRDGERWDALVLVKALVKVELDGDTTRNENFRLSFEIEWLMMDLVLLIGQYFQSLNVAGYVF